VVADEILTAHERIDVLVNNAGLISPNTGWRTGSSYFRSQPSCAVSADQSAPRYPEGVGAGTDRHRRLEAHRRNRIDIGDLTRPQD
jgi:NAD(P)-dependent dehydrogenase (short-subunit alcohol dehydrogenase family)